MTLARNTRLQRYEDDRNDAGQKFYKLKQKTRNYIDLVYRMTMGRQTLPKLDSYCGILVALRFLGAGTSRQTEPIDLLIAWVHDKNKSMFGFAHEFDRDKLRRRAAEYSWTLHDLKVIAAEWFQGKDEDKLLCLAKAVMQEHARYAVGTPPHDTIPWEIRASIRQAWEKSTAQGTPYIRLKQSLRLLGVPDKAEECRVLNWLWDKSRLEWSQIRRYPWELAHLELIASIWITARGSRTPMTKASAWLAEITEQQGPNSAGSRPEESRGQPGHLPGIHETTGRQKKRGRDEMDAEEVEELVREKSPVRGKREKFADTATLGKIATLAKAHKAAKETIDAAKKAIDDATKAYNAVAWGTTELVTHFVEQRDYAAGPVIMPGRYLEPAQEVRYPWRNVNEKRR